LSSLFRAAASTTTRDQPWKPKQRRPFSLQRLHTHIKMLSSSLRAALPLRTATAARAFATEAAHMPPKRLFGLHARYANALYVAASKAGALEQVETEVLGFQHMLAKNAEFAAYLRNPTVSREAKVGAVDKLFAGSSVSSLTQNLLSAMASNARLGETGKVVSAYAELMRAKRGEVEVTVTSAQELTKAQQGKVTKALEAQVGAGKSILLTTAVDPAIVGGLVVQIGDKVMDLSVSTKIDEISRALASA